MSKRFLKKPITYTQDLSTGPLSFTTSIPNKPFKLMWISLKATQAINETITITHLSVKGSVFDEELCTVPLVNERSFLFRPQGDSEYLAGDEFKIECTDDNSIGSVSGEFRLSETKS